MSDSVWPQRQQPTRLPCPWDSPGKSTGVGCHFLLQCVKVKSESEVTQACLTLSNPTDCSLPGSSVHGIFQARVLEWGAIAFSTFRDCCLIKTKAKQRYRQVRHCPKLRLTSQPTFSVGALPAWGLGRGSAEASVPGHCVLIWQSVLHLLWGSMPMRMDLRAFL